MASQASCSPRPRLLALSPSVDTHGADRFLLSALAALGDRFDVTLVTPRHGPLLHRAARAGWECHVVDDWALSRGGRLRSGSVPGLARRVRRSLRFLSALHQQRPFAGVYADTTATALLPFIKRAVPVPLVVQVRELPRDRPMMTKAMLRIVSRSADSVVCNSSSTAETAIAAVPRLADRIRVGLDDGSAPERLAGYVSAAVEGRPTLFVMSPSSDLYGSDRALMHALPGLLDEHDVVLGVAVDGPLVREARMVGAAAVELPDFAARRRYLKATAAPALVIRSLRVIWQVRTHVKRVDAAAVYVNTVAVPILPLLQLIAGLPVLVHVHERARGRGWEQRFIDIGVSRGADLVVANSEFTAATLAFDQDRLPVEVVYNGVEPASPAEPDPSGPVRLVCVARLHPKKGQWVLLDAVARLIGEGHDVELDLVGDALPEHAELERQLRAQVDRLGLGRRVTFHGYVTDVGSVYHRAHVVVVPSVDPEEFSLVAAEGQMRGLAAVVTGPGGVTEVVSDGETGLVVPADDVDAMARAIGELLSDRDLMSRLGKAGRDRMLDRFTTDHYRCRIKELVHGLVAGG